MVKGRSIISPAAGAAENMACDEALFEAVRTNAAVEPIVRLYTWSAPSVTIGYFQRSADIGEVAVPLVRRLTGGLMVRHNEDISYGLVVRRDNIQDFYDQDRNYAMVHEGIQKALSTVGCDTQFYAPDDVSSGQQGGLCVETTFAHDLRQGDVKVVGSCQRRRGGVFLQQGSIHLPREYARPEVFSALAQGIGEALQIVFKPGDLTANERAHAERLEHERYSRDEWNFKR